MSNKGYLIFNLRPHHALGLDTELILVYIKGVYYYPYLGITAGIIRTRVLFEGGPYMRKYGMYTANVYRELQGLYREIGVQRFQIYGDCMYTCNPCNFEISTLLFP
jgi:hypothetical protein